MTKKRRKGKRYRAQVSAARMAVMETPTQAPEVPRPSQVIERSSPVRVSELAERHRYALADVKRSLVIGAAMFVLLIVLYLLLG